MVKKLQDPLWPYVRCKTLVLKTIKKKQTPFIIHYWDSTKWSLKSTIYTTATPTVCHIKKISRNIPILTNQTHPTNRNKTWDLWTKGCEQFRYSRFPAIQKPVGFTSFAGNLGAQVAWMECLESSLAVSPCHPGQHGHTHGKGKWSEKKTDFLITQKKLPPNTQVHMGPKIQLTSIMIPDTTPKVLDLWKGKISDPTIAWGSQI